MEETIVFMDEGFLDKLVQYLGNRKRLKFDKFKLAKKLAKKQNMFCRHLFYYTAPPFQGTSPSEKEKKMKEGYDKFVDSLSKEKNITVREGRCQKILNSEGQENFNQKGVDTLLAIDLGHLKEDYPKIKKIILVSSDTDFCSSIRDIKKRDNIEVILYTFFDKKRKSKFSLSNELIDCCSEYHKLNKEDFTSCKINKDNKNKDGKKITN